MKRYSRSRSRSLFEKLFGKKQETEKQGPIEALKAIEGVEVEEKKGYCHEFEWDEKSIKRSFIIAEAEEKGVLVKYAGKNKKQGNVAWEKCVQHKVEALSAVVKTSTALNSLSELYVDKLLEKTEITSLGIETLDPIAHIYILRRDDVHEINYNVLTRERTEVALIEGLSPDEYLNHISQTEPKGNVYIVENRNVSILNPEAFVDQGIKNTMKQYIANRNALSFADRIKSGQEIACYVLMGEKND